MLIKNLCIRNRNSYYLQLLALNIHDSKTTLFQIRNRSFNMMRDKRQDYGLKCQNVSLISNSCENFSLQSFTPSLSTLRFKTTESTSESKEISEKENKTTEDVSKKETEAPLTTTEKLKKAVKEYGSTVVVFHIGISLISLGTCYLLVTSGLDVTKFLMALGLDSWLPNNQSRVAATAGTFAVAYAVHKVFAPARIAITLTSVPLIVKYLRRAGFLKK